MKLIKKILLTISIAASPLVNATPIEFGENNYITVNHDGVYLDWVWASSYNIEFFYAGSSLINELYAADYLDGEGFRDASTTEFSYFSQKVTKDNFAYSGGYKNAVSFFNSDSSFDISLSSIGNGQISGQRKLGSTDSLDAFNFDATSVFDTFYVRNSVMTSAPAPSPVPEPFSMLVFATAFILLQLKLSKKSV